MIYEVESKWKVEKHMLILKVMASVPLMKVEHMDNQMQAQLITKMAQLIIGASKFSGKPVEIPAFRQEANSLVVVAGISFNTQSNLDAYYIECQKKLNGGI